jgi:hypothetical protein
MTTEIKTPMKLQREVDQLGEINAQLADLEAQKKELRSRIIESGLMELEGRLFRATVSETNKVKIDYKAITKRLEPSRQLIRAYTSESPVIMVRCTSRTSS